MGKKIFLTEAEKKAIIVEREKSIVESFFKVFNSIKRKDEEILNEGKLSNFVSGLGMAAASCVGTGCKKYNNVFSFNIHRKTVNAIKAEPNSPNSHQTQVGKDYVWVKDTLDRTQSGVASSFSFYEKPTSEQLSVIISYMNRREEIKFSNYNRTRVGEKFFTLDLINTDINQRGENSSESTYNRITSSDYYREAYGYYSQNPEQLQRELDEFKNSTTKPVWFDETLSNFNAESILNNPENKPTRF
jgi:hypothetical protein